MGDQPERPTSSRSEPATGRPLQTDSRPTRSFFGSLEGRLERLRARASSYRKHAPRVRKILEWAVLIVAICRLIGVRWTPVVTNDSLGYLRRASSPLSTGFVAEGYRQLAYPVWLWCIDRISNLFGIDRLFAIVLCQRLLLLVALVLAWRVLRLWAAPALWFVTSTNIVFWTNFVLNESILLSLGILVAVAVIAGATSQVPLRSVPVSRHPERWLVAAIVVVMFATALKLQYVLLGLPVVALFFVLAQHRQVNVRRVLAVGVGVGVLLSIMVVGQVVENSREYDEATPLAEQQYAHWWGAYYSVFTLTPFDRVPESALEFRKDFNYYPQLRRIEPDPHKRKKIVEERIDRLFRAAGTTRRAQQGLSFFGGLAGGRHADLANLRNRVGAGQDPVAQNWLGSASGAAAVLEQVNDSHETVDWSPPSVMTATQWPLRDSKWVYSLLAVGALAGCMYGLTLRGRERWIGPASVLATVGVAALLSTGYIDIQRYLLPYVLSNLFTASWIFGRLMGTDGDQLRPSGATPHG